MSSKNYTVSISVNKTPQEAYDAIRDVKAWWVGEVKGEGKEVGSQFNFRYKHYHDSTQKVTELVPGKKVVWHVEDVGVSAINEWKGTNIVFEIVPKGKETEIVFTHHGLTPQSECYDACSGGWDFYITQSLKNLLANGQGIDPKFGE